MHKECIAVDVHIPHMTEHSEKDTKFRDVQGGKMAGQVRSGFHCWVYYIVPVRLEMITQALRGSVLSLVKWRS